MVEIIMGSEFTKLVNRSFSNASKNIVLIEYIPKQNLLLVNKILNDEYLANR